LFCFYKHVTHVRIIHEAGDAEASGPGPPGAKKILC